MRSAVIVSTLATASLWLHGCGNDGPTSLTTTSPGPSGPTTTTTTTTNARAACCFPKKKVRFTGRWYDDAALGGLKTTAWGSGMTVKFKGSSSVGIKLSSGHYAAVRGMYFVASINGGELQRFNHNNAESILQLPFALDPSDESTLFFGRSDEASSGTTTIHDIILDEGYEALEPTAARGLRVEILGDSITAGYHVTAKPGLDRNYAEKEEDFFKTYGYNLMQELGFDDWSAVTRSGVGIVERDDEYGFQDEYECREYASKKIETCSGAWDFAQWVPDVVMINLGTNDYTFLDPYPEVQSYSSLYSGLISSVRGHYPNATILCIMPLAYSCSGAQFETMGDAIMDAVSNSTDPSVHLIATGDLKHQWLNCDPANGETVDWTHPTVVGHQKFAQRMLPEIQTVLAKMAELAPVLV